MADSSRSDIFSELVIGGEMSRRDAEDADGYGPLFTVKWAGGIVDSAGVEILCYEIIRSWNCGKT